MARGASRPRSWRPPFLRNCGGAGALLREAALVCAKPALPSLPSDRTKMLMDVQVPHGAPPGALLTVQAPTGQLIQVQVPAGVGPGQVLLSLIHI